MARDDNKDVLKAIADLRAHVDDRFDALEEKVDYISEQFLTDGERAKFKKPKAPRAPSGGGGSSAGVPMAAKGR